MNPRRQARGLLDANWLSMKPVVILLAGFLLNSGSPGTEAQRPCSGQVASDWQSTECLEIGNKLRETSLTPTDGHYEVFYVDGQLKEKGTYESDRKDGLVEWFYENGVLKVRGTHQRGVGRSSWEFFDKRGDLFRTETYNVGKLHGLSEIFSEHGRLTSP